MAQRSAFCLATSRPSAGRILAELMATEISGAEVSLLYVLLASVSARKRDAATRDAMEVAVSIPGEQADGKPGWLPAVGPLLLPGSEPLMAVGPLGDTLRAARVRSLSAGLLAFGIPSTEAARYATGIDDGLVLIAVHAVNPEKSGDARTIFRRAGATDGFTMLQVSTPRYPGLRAAILGRAIAA